MGVIRSGLSGPRVRESQSWGHRLAGPQARQAGPSGPTGHRQARRGPQATGVSGSWARRQARLPDGSSGSPKREPDRFPRIVGLPEAGAQLPDEPACGLWAPTGPACGPNSPTRRACLRAVGARRACGPNSPTSLPAGPTPRRACGPNSRRPIVMFIPQNFLSKEAAARYQHAKPKRPKAGQRAQIARRFHLKFLSPFCLAPAPGSPTKMGELQCA